MESVAYGTPPHASSEKSSRVEFGQKVAKMGLCRGVRDSRTSGEADPSQTLSRSPHSGEQALWAVFTVVTSWHCPSPSVKSQHSLSGRAQQVSAGVRREPTGPASGLGRSPSSPLSWYLPCSPGLEGRLGGFKFGWPLLIHLSYPPMKSCISPPRFPPREVGRSSSHLLPVHLPFIKLMVKCTQH